jgi:hypothetical protein
MSITDIILSVNDGRIVRILHHNGNGGIIFSFHYRRIFHRRHTITIAVPVFFLPGTADVNSLTSGDSYGAV